MIKRITAPPSSVFYREYVLQDHPVILTDAIELWPARGLWSPEYFTKNFGGIEIPVECLDADRPNDPIYYLDHIKLDVPMTIGEYLELAQESESGGKFYVAQVPITKTIPGIQNDLKPLPYWSELLRRLKGGKPAFWMGPAGCASPLHFDRANNFVVQVYGRKKWVIFPRTEQHLLYVPSNLRLSHFSPIDLKAPDLAKYPAFAKASPIEFVLNAGETLFIPRGWVHYVENVEFSISLNYWWSRWVNPFRVQLAKLSMMGQEKFRVLAKERRRG